MTGPLSLLVPGCKPNAAVVHRRYKVGAGEGPKRSRMSPRAAKRRDQ
jgi:hypothetical protein